MGYLFYLLIPIGFSLLIISIKHIIRFFKTDIICELPCNAQEGSFRICNEGEYSIWVNGILLASPSIRKLGVAIINKYTKEYVPLLEVFFRTSISGFKSERVELYSFKGNEGEYIIFFTSEAGVRENMSASIQIRKNSPMYILILCVCSIILSTIFIILGIILRNVF